MSKLKHLLTIGAITLSSILPIKTNAQSIDGWLEATKGIEQGSNLRLYPLVNVQGVQYSALIDVNNFYRFSKNDFSHKDLESQVGPIKLKPMLTFHASPSRKRATIDVNASYFKNGSFGFVELDKDVSNTGDWNLYSYNSLATPLGNLALFTSSSVRDLKSTYAEVEFNIRQIFGANPYARVNLQEGVKPTYQFGISISPKKLIKKLRKK